MNYNTYVNAETGVMEEGVFIEREVYEKRMLAKERKQAGNTLRKKMDEFSEHVNLNLGSFFFNQYSKLFKEISNDSALAFRFIYLCTYADYDGILRYGVYKYGKHHDYMTEKDFKEVFGLSTRLVLDLKNKLFEHNLIKIEEGRIIVDDRYCSRGKQSKSALVESTRIFDTGIKDMYQSLKSTEHKKAGVMLLLLPYVNKFHNVICKNPKEQISSNIIPMNIQDICKSIEYDVSKARRLENELLSICVNDELCFIGSKSSLGTYYYINPRLYYSGNNVEDLKALGNMFTIQKY